MDIIDFVMDLLSLISDIQFFRRFGWGGFFLELGALVCLISAMVQYTSNRYLVGTIYLVICAVCFVLGIRCFIMNGRKNREKEEKRKDV